MNTCDKILLCTAMRRMMAANHLLAEERKAAYKRHVNAVSDVLGEELCRSAVVCQVLMLFQVKNVLVP